MLISILQIVVSVALIIVILIQERSSGTSGLFGGSGDEFYHTRRGLEKMIFYATAVLVIAFIGLSLLGIIKS
ncbi:MAG: preprotein translocase subunit SecG [Candidatus Wolfebacteria bacterium]|nr:preprotein translocase subunit SecG [Candidatus Wolfebacteria bacterium]